MKRVLARILQGTGGNPAGGFVAACLTLLERAYVFIAIVSLLGFIGVVLADVVGRQVFKYPLLVASDLAILFFVWSVMTAAAVGVRLNLHFVMDLVPDFRWAALNAARAYMLDALALAFFVLLTIRSAETTYEGFGRVFPMSGYPIGLAVAALPVAGIGASLFLIERLVRRYRGTIQVDSTAPVIVEDLS
ncbi:MAG: TRAP transporter small permease [Rhizobiaceae bacterium]|nr:TRAP transporter small permease [Rhizobiaceae bacterium]